MVNRLFALLAIILPLSVTAVAADLRFDRLSIEQGLSQTTVTSITQDRQGFLWVGALNGLNRYDGTSFRIFKHDPDNGNSIAENWVTSLCSDPDNGVIWVGTLSQGLDRFDPQTESWTHFTHDSSNANSLSSNIIRAIVRDRHGLLWIGTLGGGLNAFDPETGKFTHYKAGLNVVTLFADSENRLWIGTDRGGLDCYDSTTDRWSSVASYSDGTPIRRLRAICQDPAGALWIVTDNHTLDRLNATTRRWDHYRSDEFLSGREITALLFISPNQIWIGTDTGLLVFSTDTGLFQHYANVLYDSQSLSQDFISQIYRDRAGTVWIGTDGGGLNLYNPDKNKFVTTREVSGQPNSLSNNYVRAILLDHDDRLWVGTDGGGLNCFDRKTGKWTCYAARPAGGLSSDRIWSVFQDTQGILWISTIGGGLNRLDPRTMSWKTYRNDPANPKSIAGDVLRSIIQDRAGNLWIGSVGAGLIQFNRETEDFRNFKNDPSNPNTIGNNSPVSLLEDHSGRLWMGSIGGGLSCLDPGTHKWINYKHNRASANSLGDDMVRAVHEDKSHILWLGTNNGLDSFDEGAGKWTHYRIKDGLPDDSIYAVLADEQGFLWLSTNRGLSRFDPVRKTFRNYDVHDGLQSDEFNTGSCFRSASGEMFFGGVNGFSSFFPKLLGYNRAVPPVVITDFRVFNRSIWEQQAGCDKSAVKLSYKQNFISIEFASLNFINSGKNRFRYMLEGVDRDWVDCGNRRYATYTNLNPGKYAFHVKGSNNDGVWNQTGASLQLSIAPPFWKTWWAYSFYFILVTALILGGHSLRVRSLRAREKRLQELVDEKTGELSRSNAQLSVMIQGLQETLVRLGAANAELEKAATVRSQLLHITAHDLKNPLSTILIYARLLQKKTDPAVAEKLQTVSEQAERMRDLISSFLEREVVESGRLAFKQTDVNLARVVEQVVNNNRLFLDRKGQKVHLELDPSCTVQGDETALGQVADNLLSNAIKFSPVGKDIWMKVLFSENGWASMVVRDEGLGLSEEDRSRMFRKFQRLSARPTGDETSTGLGLSIVKSLVDLFQGRIHVQSEIGKGTTIAVELPLKRDSQSRQ